MRIGKILLLGVLIVKMAGCGFDAAPTSALELSGDDSSQVIYGKDSIQEALSGMRNSQATVALVKSSIAQQFKKQGAYTVSEQFGVDELSWSSQPSLSFCTGVLIEKDLVLTAGHCVTSAEDCEATKVALGFSADQPESAIKFLSCKQVVKSKNDIQGSGLDYALIRLEEKVSAEPVKVSVKIAQVKDRIYTLGHPLGSYRKKATGHIRKALANNDVYVSNLDVFEGNSGSPVFSSKTHELIGIVSSGESDFSQDSEGDGTVRVKRCTNEGCSGEFITPIQKVLADLHK